mmetsp:Transcript_12259/g.40263  ORF Transcript_12259/g.40263 Transcript_12259/m.40263 type:complete len:220 (-) Transcript_12259:1189-1848(-)
MRPWARHECTSAVSAVSCAHAPGARPRPTPRTEPSPLPGHRLARQAVHQSRQLHRCHGVEPVPRRKRLGNRRRGGRGDCRPSGGSRQGGGTAGGGRGGHGGKGCSGRGSGQNGGGRGGGGGGARSPCQPVVLRRHLRRDAVRQDAPSARVRRRLGVEGQVVRSRRGMDVASAAAAQLPRRVRRHLLDRVCRLLRPLHRLVPGAYGRRPVDSLLDARAVG